MTHWTHVRLKLGLLDIDKVSHKEEGQLWQLKSRSMSKRLSSLVQNVFSPNLSLLLLFWQSSHLSITVKIHAGRWQNTRWRHCKKVILFQAGCMVVRIYDNPLKRRDQDLCFWCHRVRRVKYPPVDKPYGLGRVSWVNMCGSKHHASPSADFSLSRNK